MIKNKAIVILILLIVGIYFFVTSMMGKDRFGDLKFLFNETQIETIKKYIFPYKVISQQQMTISRQKQTILDMEDYIDPILLEKELIVSKLGIDIPLNKTNSDLSNNKVLEKYRLEKGFYSGLVNIYPGSGYLDFFEDSIFVLSAHGLLAYNKDLNFKKNFIQIKNNINDFIDLKQFKKHRWFSLKDILIFNNQVFVSLTEEIENDCWNTSIIHSKLNYEKMIFKKLFTPKECVNSVNNIDNEFNAHQSGGRLVRYDDNHLLLTTGDYRNRHLAQNKDSVNGKILKININNGNYNIITMGHRNPQGLYIDKENNFILEAEHGPQGGDEINLVDINVISKDNILNYGWAIVSAGEHYGGKIKRNENKYEKYPLHKSHTEHGFIEPLKSFVPSIGISEIVKINDNKYVVGSMKDKSLYFFDLKENKKITNLYRVEVFERIRDLKFYKNKLYMFLEDSASIGILNYE